MTTTKTDRHTFTLRADGAVVVTTAGGIPVDLVPLSDRPGDPLLDVFAQEWTKAWA